MQYKYMIIQGREHSWVTKYPYDVVYTNFVGTIVYEDDWQIAVQVENGKMI